ncbi:MAG: hypothetical protein RL213_2257 [Bacteroidota bacterium]
MNGDMTGTFPKITIVTPSLNQVRFIEETILSVIHQGYPALEFIVIDGGSNDGTTEILQSYEEHIDFWCSEKDKGQSDAVNKGFSKATGELMTWLCSDDLLEPGALESVAALYKKHPEGGLFVGRCRIFGDRRKESKLTPPSEDIAGHCLAGVPFAQPASFFTRKAFERCGPLDTMLHYGMDFALFQKIALEFDIITDENVWASYRIHTGSKTGSRLRDFAVEWSRVFSRFLNSVSVQPSVLKRLREAGLLYEEEPALQHNLRFTEQEILRIVCHFLLDQFRIRYETLDRREGLKIIRLIRTLDEDYLTAARLSRPEFQLRYVPVPLFRFIRRLTR